MFIVYESSTQTNSSLISELMKLTLFNFGDIANPLTLKRKESGALHQKAKMEMNCTLLSGSTYALSKSKPFLMDLDLALRFACLSKKN